ncbi:hypothetical protein AB9F39_35700 [Rhizobium leguminosarum]
MLFDSDRDALQEKAEAVRRLIQAEGFGARIETLMGRSGFRTRPSSAGSSRRDCWC